MKKRGIILFSFALLLAAPLLGGWLRGLPEAFTRFPPLLHAPPDVPPFSWPVFGFFALLGLGAGAALACPRLAGFRPAGGEEHEAPRGRFPAWGWVGLALGLAAWLCAWGQFAWLGRWRDHTFFPLWLAYVMVVDALTYLRTDNSFCTRNRRRLPGLFLASALSWWYFEYLNRFVQNWWYLGAGHFSPTRYIVNASLCFSTVLPAVMVSASLLRSFSFFRVAFRGGPRLPSLTDRGATVMLVAGSLGLGLLTYWPHQAFYLVWLAPLMILLGGLHLAGVKEPLGALHLGDYTEVATLAAAALLCGFFWEFWNFWSLPKWVYSVPYVTGVRVFEMPVVGYTGYLPFGPLCACFWLAFRVLAGSSTSSNDHVSSR